MEAQPLPGELKNTSRKQVYINKEGGLWDIVVIIMANLKDNAFCNRRTGVSVQFLQQKAQEMSAISDWYCVRFFYASNTKGENVVLVWHHKVFQRRHIAQLEDRNIGSNIAAEITGYFQSEDRRIGFISSAEIIVNVFNWRLKWRTLLSCFQNDAFWNNCDIFMLP